ncbi:hypothetical protein SFRURICE_004352 [Spodoptera frugiperda]|nr:hypothetical protein SFRURICE_004352 [Spodoptera frugiperda]
MGAFPAEMCYAMILWMRLASTNHINRYIQLSTGANFFSSPCIGNLIGSPQLRVGISPYGPYLW